MTDQERLFEVWWQRDGKFIDPDTSDVPWFDKRKALAASAFEAAMQASRNYTADDASEPEQFTFANGCIVTLADDASLKMTMPTNKPHLNRSKLPDTDA